MEMTRGKRRLATAARSKSLSLLSLFLLAACGDGTRNDQGAVSAATAGTDAWLPGIWVYSREECAGSDNLLNLSADHTYYDVGASGNWDLSGNILSLTALRTFDLGEEGEQVVQNPQAYQLAILRRTEDAIQVRNPEGETWQMFRCADKK